MAALPTTGARPGTSTHRDRVVAALEGRIIDRPPYAVWRHFPGEDQQAETFAAATVRFQELSRSDFVKLMPTGMYAVLDYGVTVRTSPDDIGTTRFVDGPIGSPGDWKSLRSADPTKGVLGDQLRVIRMVRESLGPDVPILQTIFSPLSLAAKLAGSRTLLFASLASLHHELRDALHRLTEDIQSFAGACLDVGADGFFFATQFADRDVFPESEYWRWGVPFDLEVIEAVRDQARPIVLHLHGTNPLFELADIYPIDIVNWHDRDSPVDLRRGLNATTRTLLGGLSRRGPILSEGIDGTVHEVMDALAQTHGRRLIVGPGCVLPFAAPERNITAIRRCLDAVAPLYQEVYR